MPSCPPAYPPGYQCTAAHVTRLVGGRDIAVRVYELPPGQNVCPYHYEYEEEWLIVLEGALTPAHARRGGAARARGRRLLRRPARPVRTRSPTTTRKSQRAC